MPLSGRDDEVRRLAEAAAADAVQAVLVTGEAGVGKTSLVAQHVADSPRLVLRGQCVPLTNSIPLLPLLGAMGSRDSAVRAEVDSALAGLAAHVVEALSGVLPRLAPAGGMSPMAEDRLFIAVGELLAELGSRARVTLIIEDVHWADRATLDLLTYLMLARNDPGVTVVVTYRSGEADPAPTAGAWLDRVRTAPNAVEIALAPLDRAAFDDQLATLAPGIESSAADRLFERSEGNPFYTEQLLATAASSSTGLLPDRVAALLGVRLDRLTEVQRQLMVVLALAARPLPVDSLARVVGIAEADAVRAVQQLADASLVAVQDREVRPRHALVREAVLAGSPVVTGEVHGRLGRELEAMDARDLAPEAASHYRVAGLTDDELRTARVAATRAWELASYAEAADWGLRTFALLDEMPEKRQAGAGLGLLAWRTVRSLGHSGRASEEESFGRRIWDIFREWPDPEERGLVLTQVSALETTKNWWALPPSAQALLDESDLPDSASHTSFLYNVAVAVARQGDLDRGRELLDRALEMAIRVEAWEEAVIATAWQSVLGRGRLEPEPVGETLARVDAFASRVTTARGRLNYSIMASDLLLKDGQPEAARARAKAGWDLAVRDGLASAFHASVVLANVVEACCEMGLVGEAEELIAAFAESGHRYDDPVAEALMSIGRSQIALLRGRPDLPELNPRLGDDFQRETTELRTEQLLWQGDPASAYQAAIAGLSRLLRPEAVFDRPMAGELLTLAARAAADLGDPAHLDEMEAMRSRFAEAGEDPLRPRPSLGRIRGDAAVWAAELARGHGTDTVDQWQEVATIWEERAYPHRAAYGWWRAAQRALREPVDRRAAADALRRAHDLAAEHEPLRAEVRGLADRLRMAGLGAEGLPVHGRYESLTAQEQRVLRLVAQGWTNAQIAEELFISPKTASVHVSNILRKLGVANRAAATGWAHSVGLVDK